MAEPWQVVQVQKQESAALGGSAADEEPYDEPINPAEDQIEAAGYVVQDATNRDQKVKVWRDTGNMKFKDEANPAGVTLTDLLATGGLTAAQHEALPTLTHDIVASSWDEITRDSFRRINNITTWTQQALPHIKVREVQLTRDGAGHVSQIITIQYDTGGAELYRLVESVNRDGFRKITDIVRTRGV